MTICYFGHYQPAYCRNKNIITGLRLNGVDVLEVQDRTPGVLKFFRLYKKYWAIRKKFDWMIVGFPGQIMVPFAKLLTRKSVIFDAHVSLYDSNVFERHLCGKYSLRAAWFYFLDWFSCRLADRVLLDTWAHVDYFVKTFHLPKEKFIVVYHGSDDSLFRPLPKRTSKDKLVVEFHGYITDLHGIEYVLEAMQLLSDEAVELVVVADTKRPDCQEKIELAKTLGLQNVTFLPVIPQSELSEFIATADVGLGIVGKTNKVDRVIPNKLYELMLTKTPVISADTAGIREMFEPGVHFYGCPKANAQAIADAIMDLGRQPDVRQKLAEQAYQKMKQSLVPSEIGKKLLSDLSAHL